MYKQSHTWESETQQINPSSKRRIMKWHKLSCFTSQYLNEHTKSWIRLCPGRNWQHPLSDPLHRTRIPIISGSNGDDHYSQTSSKLMVPIKAPSSEPLRWKVTQAA